MHRLVIMLGISLVAVFCCVWQHVQWVQMGRVLTQKEQQLKDLQLQLRTLELKAASLSSLERIEQVSREQLGMIKGGTAETIVTHNAATKYLIAERILTQQTAKGGVPTLMPSFTTLADASSSNRKGSDKASSRRRA